MDTPTEQPTEERKAAAIKLLADLKALYKKMSEQEQDIVVVQLLDLIHVIEDGAKNG